jgi:hypothetical protein
MFLPHQQPALAGLPVASPNSLDSSGYLFIFKGLHRALATGVPGGKLFCVCKLNV